MSLSDPKIQIQFDPEQIHRGSLVVLELSVMVSKIMHICACSFSAKRI